MTWPGISRKIVSCFDRVSQPSSFRRIFRRIVAGMVSGASRTALGQPMPARRERLRGRGSLRLCGVALAAVACLTGCNGSTNATDNLIVAFSPLAGVRPPANEYQGNYTSQANDATDETAAMAGVPGTLFARQSDCSVAGVSFSNVALTSMNGYSGTFSGTFTPTVTPNYGSTLHSLSGLTTKAGVFANGCTDRTAGTSGQAAALLASTPGGSYVGAAIDNIHNTLYVGAIQTAGTFSGTMLSLTNVFSVYVGDPNSEGVRQLIVPQLVASTTGGYPTYFLYTINVHADGTSDTPVQVATPYSGAAFNLVVDDFNGDGKLDLGFTNQNYAGPVTVLLGGGNGTFGAPIASVTVPYSYSSQILTGDFNGDGKRDVFTGSNILFGKGDGTFTLGPASPAAGATVVADFNNDGKDDIATYTKGVISISLGKGDGTFTPLGSTYAGLYGQPTLAVTDIDGDGNMDLVVGAGQSGLYLPAINSQGITMFLMGNGDGTFRGAPIYSHDAGDGYHGAFAAGDFNSDGNIDVLVPASGAGNSFTGLQVLLGNGTGVLTPQTNNTAAAPYFVAAADINGDGKLDAVGLTSTPNASGSSDLAFVTLRGNGDGTFAMPISYVVGTPPPNGYFSSDLAMGDTRGTGKPDAVLYQNGSLYLLANNGDGTFASPVLLDTENGFQSLAVVDVNGDGKADIVALTATAVTPIDNTNTLVVYLSNGNGTFAAPVTLAASLADAQDIAVADVNKDGKADIVLLSSSYTAGTSSLTSYLGHGDGTFSAGVNSTLGGLYQVSIALGDANGDGKPDVLIGACCGNTLASLAFGNGDGTFAANYGLSIGPSTSAVGFADLNNDGRPDLLLASNSNLVTSLNLFGSTLTAPLTATSTTLTLSPAAPTAGQSLLFNATVAPTTGSGVPTGTVTFLDGTTILGTGTVSSGKASFTGSLGSGTHSISASYSGDATYAASVSAADVLTIASAPALAATTTQLSATPTSAIAGTAIAMSVSVRESAGTGVPTGTVSFSDGATPIGTAPLTAGGATLSIAMFSVGTHSIMAAYGGDAANAASSSSAVAVSITAAPVPDFSMALNPSIGTVSAGSSTASTITITPAGGFNQAIGFTCSGLPANSSSTFSPTSVTPNGTGTSTSTLTIATSVKVATLHADPLRTPGGGISLALMAGGGSLGLLWLRRRQKNTGLWLVQISAVGALMLTSAMVGCGQGASTTTKTPTGTSQITVTATAGSTVHTVTYRLTVQ
jgi:hypothetical protein